MRSRLFLLALAGLCLGRPDIGLELRKPLQTSYGVPVESVTALPPVHNYQNYLPPSPTFQTPLVSTAVPFYSGPTITPFVVGHGYVSPFSSQQHVYHQSSHYQTGVHQTQVQKHVYFYEAPEDHEDIRPPVAPTASPSRKNVKIIFIKAPTYNLSPYAQPIYPQQQEKTIVYVLVKKPEVQEQIVVEPPPPTPPTKPEVFFIKYKSQAEAEEKVQDTLKTHEESGANVITNNVETAPIGAEHYVTGLPILPTVSPIFPNYVPTSVIDPGVSITSNGISGHFVSSTESPFIGSTYGPPIVSSTESPFIGSTYGPPIVSSTESPFIGGTYGPPIVSSTGSPFIGSTYGPSIVSSTESPFIGSTYGPPIVSSTERPIISSTYEPSIDANQIVGSYGTPPKPHETYGVPSKK